MKPLPIVISIDLSFIAVIYLFCQFVLNSPTFIPFFMTLLAVFNLVMMLLFIIEKRKSFVNAFLVGFLITATTAVTAWYLYYTYIRDVHKFLNE